MYLINRTIAIIKPKQPYLDWAISLPDPAENLTLEELREDCTAILIPEYGYPSELEANIKEIYSAVFETELDAWHRDTSQWPARRDYQTFQAWFDVEVHSMAFDFVEGEIVREMVDSNGDERRSGQDIM